MQTVIINLFMLNNIKMNFSNQNFSVIYFPAVGVLVGKRNTLTGRGLRAAQGTQEL